MANMASLFRPPRRGRSQGCPCQGEQACRCGCPREGARQDRRQAVSRRSIAQLVPLFVHHRNPGPFASVANAAVADSRRRPPRDAFSSADNTRCCGKISRRSSQNPPPGSVAYEPIPASSILPAAGNRNNGNAKRAPAPSRFEGSVEHRGRPQPSRNADRRKPKDGEGGRRDRVTAPAVGESPPDPRPKFRFRWRADPGASSPDPSTGSRPERSRASGAPFPRRRALRDEKKQRRWRSSRFAVD